ncbi:MAG: hypothetical protein AAGD11_01070 [Planctomycetota bacterium]
MIRRALIGLAMLLAVVAAASSVEARTCRGQSGFYGGGFYGGGYRAPVYRSARYYGGPNYYYGRGPAVYRRAYYGGYPAYYGGPRSGVTLSFGF